MSKFSSISRAFLILIALAQVPAYGGSNLPADLQAKAAYEQAVRQKKPDARQTYINKLAEILDDDMLKFLTEGDRSASAQLKRIYAELKKFPAPANSDSRALTKLRAGKWESPRHQYLYRANGTWSMLPLEPGVTAGHWRIEGNRYFDGVDSRFKPADHYTIILLDKNYFIFMDSNTVFFEHRLGI